VGGILKDRKHRRKMYRTVLDVQFEMPGLSPVERSCRREAKERVCTRNASFDTTDVSMWWWKP
jgi:hypothetical protein